jgi:hypothetical protein
MSTHNRYESRFKQERFRFFIFASLAVLAPIMALLIPALKPNHIEIGDWFARSGAAMVVFALLAEKQGSGDTYNLWNANIHFREREDQSTLFCYAFFMVFKKSFTMYDSYK